ncbi:MAG: hypothetical protein WCV99_06915 [Sterolibacterium sp.]
MDTTFDVAAGLVGLTVVLPRRNAITPAINNTTPLQTKPAATAIRHGSSKASKGNCADAYHIAPTTMIANATGGTFSSRLNMTLSIWHNVVVWLNGKRKIRSEDRIEHAVRGGLTT